MRREDIANFLNAERRISPLTAFSLLIAAGFFAGSLQLVGPQQPQTVAMTEQQPQTIAMNPPVDPVAMTAAVTSTNDDEPVTSTFDNFKPEDAPENCTNAIQAALGQEKGPEVTQTDKGQSGKMDFCFGGIVKQGKQPSKKPEDYDCVGRKGKVTISKDSTVTKTSPDREAQKGQCKVEVCQQLPPVGTKPPEEKCGPPKQFGAGQQAGSQSGGLPQMPQIPGAGAGGGGSQPQTTPQPNAQPLTRSVPTCSGVDAECTGTKPAEVKPKDPTLLEEVKPGERTFTALCSNGPCPTTAEPTPAKLDGLGAVVPGDANDGLVAPKRDSSLLDPEPDPGTTNIKTSPLQSSTFQPVDGGLGTAYDRETGKAVDLSKIETDPGVKKLEDFNGRWADSDQKLATTATGFCAGDPACSSYAKGPQAPLGACAGDPNCTTIVKNDIQGPRAPCGSDPCVPGAADRTTPLATPKEEKPPVVPPAEKPPVVPPAEKPPAERPATERPATTIPDPQTAPRPTSGSGISPSGLLSFLGGFMKGLGIGGSSQSQQQSGTAQTCPTDPNAYAQYQQQYNQQLQQYNYQLQQYNYQIQNNQAYGYTSSVTPPPPPAPQPCRPGYGSNSGDGQCPQLPAQPSPTTCPTGSWRQMTATGAGMVCPVWQCVTTNATTPTAQIACNPDVVEKGSRVTISYTCTNSTHSTGSGFDSGGATAGATTTTILTPPENAEAINYAIKCEDGTVTAGAQCTVQIAKVSISLRAEPTTAPVGKEALIGWVTTGMKSCVVSSPDQPDFTDRNAGISRTAGIATTSAMTEKSDFYLDCITVTGDTRQEKITVDVYHPGTVTASIENRTDVVRGSTATIRWSFPDAPDVSAVALWLYSVQDKKTIALISGHRAKAGTYKWDIPTEDEDCNKSSSIVCGTDLVPGATYAILASVYQPTNANLGEFNDPSLPKPKFIDNPISAAFQITR